MDTKKSLIDLICKGYCKFYKESKDEELSCEGFKFFERFFHLPANNPDKKDYPSVFQYDSILMDILCKKCDFLIGGCDYRDEEHLSSAPPCGG
ncbi:MAG: hypothetical protein HY279_08035, partial [Nitrospinae bacterium]|nr:hypothetical protein [Nitrospinota bacterium]